MQKDVCPSLVRRAGAVLINSNGQRFCNELDLSKKISEAILSRCGQHPARLSSGREQHVAYLLINQEVMQRIEGDAASVLEHRNAGVSYGTIAQFCEDRGIPVDALEQTFQSYRRWGEAGGQCGLHTHPVIYIGLLSSELMNSGNLSFLLRISPSATPSGCSKLLL
jgi:hypothetical protein